MCTQFLHLLFGHPTPVHKAAGRLRSLAQTAQT